MKINTLVTHKQLKSVGIGCISKVLKTKYKVNFGRHDVMDCSKKMLVEVDTSKCKEIEFNKFKVMQLSVENAPDYVIIGNELKHYVGIGYVSHGVVTLEDLKKYPRIV